MLARILGLSVAHFLVSTAAALLAYGLDLDQVRSRSILSRAAGTVHDVLWYPHDALLRALPSGSITRPGVVPAVLIGGSLAWGVALYVLWRAARAWSAGSHRSSGPPG